MLHLQRGFMRRIGVCNQQLSKRNDSTIAGIHGIKFHEQFLGKFSRQPLGMAKRLEILSLKDMLDIKPLPLANGINNMITKIALDKRSRQNQGKCLPTASSANLIQSYLNSMAITWNRFHFADIDSYDSLSKSNPSNMQIPPTPPRKSHPQKDKFTHNTPMLGGERLTLRFDITGSATHIAMSRHDALKMVQDAAATLAEVNDETSTRQPSRADKGIVTIPNIHMRDIRKLDNAFAIANKPSIIVRRQGILVNADPIRAVITRDSCVVFLQDGAEDLIPELEFNFKDHMDECELHGFEFTALEAILATICTSLVKDCERELPLAHAAVERISHDGTFAGELESLRLAKNQIDELNSRVIGMRKAFVDILENEEDLRMMHLTKLYNNPSFEFDLFSFDSEDLESLIEIYLQDIYNTQTKISLMVDNIKNTRNISMLKLDSKRNYLLMINLTLTLWTTLITIPTFLVGTFGMNLKSNLEEIENLFYIIFIICIIFPIGIYFIILKYLKKHGINLKWKYK